MVLNDDMTKLTDSIDSAINNLKTARLLVNEGHLDLVATQLEDAFCKMQNINDTYCVEVK